MYYRKKGKYMYICEDKKGKEKVVLYLGTAEKLLERLKTREKPAQKPE